MSVVKKTKTSRIISSSNAECILNTMGAHPYILTFLICFILNSFYLGQISYVPQNTLTISVTAFFYWHLF